MVDILGVLPPLSVGYAIGTLVKAFVAFIAIVVADKIIAHEINIKHSLIIAIVSLFLIPIVGNLITQFISLPMLVFNYILPLVVWIILGEILLKSDMKTKLKVIVIAFVVYAILEYVGVPFIIAGLIPF